MYTINHLKTENVLELKNPDASFYAKIYLSKGASLQELTLNSHAIMVDLDPLVYADTYASSIMFPFANRVKDGAYSFNNKQYQLHTNNQTEKNALHGLIYNKTFKVVESVCNNSSVSVTLEYQENNLSVGFPFKYAVQLKYSFNKKTMSLEVLVKNTNNDPFPFTMGWHPYFLSDNLYESTLEFSSTKKTRSGERNITKGIENVEDVGVFNVYDKSLDDCWKLSKNSIKFITPKYRFVLESSEADSFLQLYTPPKKNIIAIEPTTGVSDSFNNKIGLKILPPNATYRIEWKLKMI